MITKDHIRLMMRMLNAFENDSASPETDYRSIYCYNDGPNGVKQVTLGRGFTQFGGSLGLVIERYIKKGGQRTRMLDLWNAGKHSSSLANDKEFTDRLRDASTEPAMRDAQDEIFTEVYITPALSWADTRGFVLPLSNAVIVDSYLHSGGMLSFLMDRFPEKKPNMGGDEKSWIRAYVDTRRAWLKGKGKPLSNTLYRADFFLKQMAAGNWEFNCPMVANDSNIC